MPNIAYVNGRYQHMHQARIMVEDRGYQFADGVYEVCAVRAGRAREVAAHLSRLHRSCAALSLPLPMSDTILAHIMDEVIRRNRVYDGVIYLQLTRGVAPREHIYRHTLSPVLTIVAREQNPKMRTQLHSQGIKVITMADIRWGRVDIKSTALLPNVLARQSAFEQGANEAWLVDAAGRITEGAATNAWIVDKQNCLRTRAVDNILAGITRETLFKLASEQGLKILEKPFTPDEAKAARECFATASTLTILPVVKLDDVQIGNGKPGPVSKKLYALYEKAVLS